MAAANLTGKNVRGLQETLRELRKFHPDLLKELRKDLRKTADPIVKDARSRVPAQPASGWREGGRIGFKQSKARSGYKLRMRSSARVSGMKGSAATIDLVQNNAAGAIWDQAGQRGNYKPPTQRGAAFVDALTRSSGKAQRGLWPASVGKRKDLARAFEASIRDAERKANLRMKAARG